MIAQSDKVEEHLHLDLLQELLRIVSYPHRAFGLEGNFIITQGFSALKENFIITGLLTSPLGGAFGGLVASEAAATSVRSLAFVAIKVTSL